MIENGFSSTQSMRVVLVLLCGCAQRHPAERELAGPIEIFLTASGTTWQAELGVHGRRIPAGHDVHVPLGTEVRLVLASHDYITTFALPELDKRDFAAPDLAAEIRFTPDRLGRFELRGDELCGAAHPDDARGTFVIESPSAFRSWLAEVSR